MNEVLDTDYLVIGTGIAGLNFALLAAEHGRVVVVTKKRPDDTNTNWAQGGVAAALSSDDSFALHIEDTLKAGDGLCDRDVVEMCVSEGPAQVQRLLDLLSMAKYGGDPACFGAYVLDAKSGMVKTLCARATVLASGGTGKVFLYTSNPDVATGDGVAMAYRIGAAVCDLEFVQFHPTVLFHPHARNFLISEALRGEGGILKLATGETFMENYSEMKSLASRDIVARAIDNELKKSGADCVFLDMTHLDPAFVRGRFPNIYERCLGLGIDMTKQPIPVVPAAHYMCGGVKTDKTGATTIAGLYAIGECAFTGLHGANRLASNSLLEGMVYSAHAAAAVKDAPRHRPTQVAPWSSGDATDSNDAIVVTLNWEEIRRFMWSYLGIVRSNKRIERARHRIDVLRDEIREYYMDFKITSDLIELRNLALTAHLVIESARRRKESRGLHSSLDYPEKLPEARHSELQLTNGPRG